MSQEVHHYNKKETGSQKNLLIKTDPNEKVQGASKYRWLLVLISVLVLLILFLASWVNFAQRPVTLGGGDFQYFEIKQGQSSRETAKLLKEKSLIRSEYAFLANAKLSGKPIQAGYYKISNSMSLSEILDKFQKGETDAYSITVPEGFRVLQIAKLIEEKADIDHNKFIESAIGKEGTLFPDTYVFPTNYDSSKIISKMKEDFDQRVAKLRPSQEQIIIASIVEREAKKDEERAKIAAVYKNRFDNNMMLQADPTVRYALDTQEFLNEKRVDFNFWQPISRQDIQNINSPFNTYKQKGLPPAPICNAGLKSLEASVNPAKDFGDYFYFFHDKNQEVHFSKNLQEHQEAIKKYGLPGQ